MLPEHSKIKLCLISGILALVTTAETFSQAKPDDKSSSASSASAKVTSSKSTQNSSSSTSVPTTSSKDTKAVLSEPQSKKDQSTKDDWWFVPYVISFIALCVSGSTAIYTFRKDARARRHSIEDDYWLRKIIGPVAIEPLLKNVLEMIGSAPADKASGNFEDEKVKTFHDEFLKKFVDLAANVSSLSLINAGLAASTSVHLDGIQDLMIDYCSSNQLADSSAQVPPVTRKEFQDKARKQLIIMLQGIKTYQMQIT